MKITYEFEPQDIKVGLKVVNSFNSRYIIVGCAHRDYKYNLLLLENYHLVYEVSVYNDELANNLNKYKFRLDYDK